MDCQLKRTRGCRRSNLGFSLLELLVVMAILGILTLSISSFGFSNSMKVTTTGQLVRDNLNFARTTAISRNRSVRVLFYKIPSTTTGATQYRGMQLFVLDANETNPVQLTKFISFPTSLIADSASVTYATLLSGTAGSLNGTMTLTNPAGTYTYEGFTYKSDGSTDLAAKGPGGDTWFVLIRSEQDKAAPPKNYYIVQIDPINGRTQTFRP